MRLSVRRLAHSVTYERDSPLSQCDAGEWDNNLRPAISGVQFVPPLLERTGLMGLGHQTGQYRFEIRGLPDDGLYSLSEMLIATLSRYTVPY